MILSGFLGGLLGFFNDGGEPFTVIAFLPLVVVSPDSCEGAGGGQECAG